MSLLEQLDADIENGVIDVMEFESVDHAYDIATEKVNSGELLDDESAFRILMQAMDYMRDSGEFDRLQAVSMELGAMACLHGGLQERAEEVSFRYSDILGLGHGKSDDSEKPTPKSPKAESDANKKKKKGKTTKRKPLLTLSR